MDILLGVGIIALAVASIFTTRLIVNLRHDLTWLRRHVRDLQCRVIDLEDHLHPPKPAAMRINPGTPIKED